MTIHLSKITLPMFVALFFVTVFLGACSNNSVESRLSSAEHQLQEQHYATAIINLKGILIDEPDNIQALKLLGSAYHKVEFFAEAEQKLKRVINTPMADNTTQLKYADSLLQLKKHQAALDAINQRSFTEGSAAQASSIQALALVGLGKVNEAEHIAHDASKTFPDSADLNIALSKIYLKQGKRSASIRAARQAVRIDPADYRGHELLGSLLLNEQMFVDAIDSFQLALQTDPAGDTSLVAIRVNLNLFRCYLAISDLESALATLDKLQARAPEHPGVTYSATLMQFNAKDYDAAYQSARATLAKIPNHQPSQLLAGIASYRLNNLEQANVYLGKVLANDPTNAEARKLYAATQLKLNNPSGASKTLQEGVRKNPNDISLQMISAELQEVSDEARESELSATSELPAAFDNLIASLDDNQSIVIRTEVRAMRQLADHGNVDEAFARALAIIEKYPNEPGLYGFAGIIAQLANHPDDANTFYLTAIEMNPEDIGSAINLVNLHKLAGTDVDAQRSLEKLLKEAPGSLAALTGLAKIARDNKWHGSAATYLKQAIAANPTIPEPRLTLIRLHQQNNNLEAASLELAAAIAADPGDDNFRILQAQQLIITGDPADAVELLRPILANEPESVNALLTLSVAFSALGKPEQAIVPLRKAHQLLPKSYKLTARLAMLQIRLGNSDEALSIVQNYRSISQDQAGSYSLVATIKMSQGDYQGAAEQYGKAQAVIPSERTLLLQVAAIQRTGDSEQAIELLDQWVEENPDNKKSRFELATLQLFSGNYGDATYHYEILIDQGGEIADLFNNLAWAYQQLNDPRALKTAEAGHARFPDDPMLADTLGWVLVTEKQDLRRAIELLQHAYKQTNNPSIGYHLAQAQMQHGDNEAALATLKTLLNRGEGFPEQEAANKLHAQVEREN